MSTGALEQICAVHSRFFVLAGPQQGQDANHHRPEVVELACANAIERLLAGSQRAQCFRVVAAE